MLLTSLRLLIVIGLDYFIVMRLKDYLFPNNDLEQAFGILRHHQRRCTGRKVAPSSLVIRGSVQLACAITTALQPFSAEDLSQVSVQAWLQLRSDLRQHQLTRIEQLRFRRNPQVYLASLETQLLQLTLPL